MVPDNPTPSNQAAFGDTVTIGADSMQDNMDTGVLISDSFAQITVSQSGTFTPDPNYTEGLDTSGTPLSVTLTIKNLSNERMDLSGMSSSTCQSSGESCVTYLDAGDYSGPVQYLRAGETLAFKQGFFVKDPSDVIIEVLMPTSDTMYPAPASVTFDTKG